MSATTGWRLKGNSAPKTGRQKAYAGRRSRRTERFARTRKSLPPVAESADPGHALADALKKRLALVADREFYRRDPAAHLAQLQAISERINALAEDLPPGTDPQFAHYLQRCSFDKALAFIEAGRAV